MSAKKNKDKNLNVINKKPISHDPRKHPRPGYDEKNPTKKNDINYKPKNQRPG
jgi:hypothetical protein